MSKGHARRGVERESGHEQIAAAFAACLLETDGWRQWDLGGRGDGRPSCMVGALMPFMQPGAGGDYRSASMATLDVGDLCAGPGGAGTLWNDYDGRTDTQVIAALRKFADGR